MRQIELSSPKADPSYISAEKMPLAARRASVDLVFPTVHHLRRKKKDARTK